MVGDEHRSLCRKESYISMHQVLDYPNIILYVNKF